MYEWILLTIILVADTASSRELRARIDVKRFPTLEACQLYLYPYWNRTNNECIMVPKDIR